MQCFIYKACKDLNNKKRWNYVHCQIDIVYWFLKYHILTKNRLVYGIIIYRSRKIIYENLGGSYDRLLYSSNWKYSKWEDLWKISKYIKKSNDMF